MGAEQSRAENKTLSDGDSTSKTCYYEVLGITIQASEDDIKKAYRRKALELHPDRNFGNVENATRQFAEVQSAYQLLSDPHERAWYDSHRSQILRGDDTRESTQYDRNIKVTGTDELVNLMGRFSVNVPFTDAPNGFYGVLRSTFQKLADEEIVACEWTDNEPIDLPDFGGKDDDYDDVVRPFYTMWSSFSTQKTFYWKDSYNLNEATDRRIRRLMEQENAKNRDFGRRDFNTAVQELVSFVKKRDPRYVQNIVSTNERQRQLKEASRGQAARARAANRANMVEQEIPDWARRTAVEEETGTFSDTSTSEDEIFECVACGKIFKSEKQYDAHEKSKKHLKIVQHLKRQMKKENDHLILGNATDPLPLQDVDKITEDDWEARVDGDSIPHIPDPSQKEFTHDRSSQAEPVNANPQTLSDVEQVTTSIASAEEDLEAESDDEYVCRQEVINRLNKNTTNNIVDHSHFSSPDVEELSNSAKDVSLVDGREDGLDRKMGKAKAKRARRAARQQPENTETKNVCTACAQDFPSRNDLFHHIKENPKHAQPIDTRHVHNGTKLKGKRNLK